jgi:hypothetical protein
MNLIVSVHLCLNVLFSSRHVKEFSRGCGGDGNDEENEEKDEEPGSSLQALFRETPRDQEESIWKDADIASGSVAANALVTQQLANRMVVCAKAILVTSQVVLGLVCMTVVERT